MPSSRTAAALLATAFAVLVAGAPVRAAETSQAEMTCDIAFDAKAAGAFAERVTWTVGAGEGLFTMTSADGPALSGTYRERRSKLRCAFDAASLDALVAWALSGTPGVSAASVKRQKVTLTFGPTRETRRITAKLKLRATTSAGQKPSVLRIGGDATSRRVLVLNDGLSLAEGSGTQVVGALRTAGHRVTEGGFYQDWDGSGLADVETVVLLQGWEFADVMKEQADAALAAFVRAGGGLVRTEMAAGIIAGSPYLEIDTLLPVESPNGETAEDTAWQIVRPGHPLARRLPRAFLVRHAGYAFVFPVAGAEVVAENPFAVPMITAASAGAGRVVHVNHDLTFLSPSIQGEILQVLVNAAEYTAP